MFKLLRGLFTPTKHGDPRDLFADEVTTLARRLPNIAEVSRVEGAFALDVVATSGGQHRMFLDNAFAETRELPPDERAARIAWHFAGIGDARDTSWQASRASVAPVVRGATFGIEAWAADPAVQMLRRPFVPFVDAMVVIDLPTSMSYVNAKSVADWGIGEDEVFAAEVE
jgi:hypothetical protein